MTYFLFRGRHDGTHVRVGVWAGTESQANQHARVKAGQLTLTPQEWSDLRNQLARLEGHGPAIFDVEEVR